MKITSDSFYDTVKLSSPRTLALGLCSVRCGLLHARDTALKLIRNICHAPVPDWSAITACASKDLQ